MSSDLIVSWLLVPDGPVWVFQKPLIYSEFLESLHSSLPFLLLYTAISVKSFQPSIRRSYLLKLTKKSKVKRIPGCFTFRLHLCRLQMILYSWNRKSVENICSEYGTYLDFYQFAQAAAKFPCYRNV